MKVLVNVAIMLTGQLEIDMKAGTCQIMHSHDYEHATIVISKDENVTPEQMDLAVPELQDIAFHRLAAEYHKRMHAARVEQGALETTPDELKKDGMN